MIYYNINLDFAYGNISVIRTGTTIGGNGTANDHWNPQKTQKQKTQNILKTFREGGNGLG